MKKENKSYAYYFQKFTPITATYKVERTLPDMDLYFDNFKFRKGFDIRIRRGAK